MPNLRRIRLGEVLSSDVPYTSVYEPYQCLFKKTCYFLITKYNHFEVHDGWSSGSAFPEERIPVVTSI